MRSIAQTSTATTVQQGPIAALDFHKSLSAKSQITYGRALFSGCPFPHIENQRTTLGMHKKPVPQLDLVVGSSIYASSLEDSSEYLMISK